MPPPMIGGMPMAGGGMPMGAGGIPMGGMGGLRPPPPPAPLPRAHPPPPPVPGRPAGGYKLPPSCTPYQTDAPKQRRFELFVHSEKSARDAGKDARMHAHEIDAEIVEFAKVALFFSQQV